MAIDQKAVADYAAELAEAAGIPAEQRPAFLSNEKVLAAARKRFEDVEREKGRVVAEQQARQKEYEDNLKIANHNRQVVEDAQKQVQAYVARYGELPGGGNPNDPNARREAVAEVIDKKTFDERIAQTEGMAVEMAKLAADLKLDYYIQFGENLNLDEVQKIAVEQKVNARQAYAIYTRPKTEAKQNKDFEAKLAAAREEGIREGASKSAAARITGGEPQNGFMANYVKKADEKTPGTLTSAFVEAYNAAQKPGSTA